MAMVNVNTDGLIKYSKKLDRMSRYALPIVVRQTLNSLAFDSKKRTIPEEAEKSFVNRSKGFYKRFSKVETARGNNINSMKSKVGMSGDSQAVKNQTQQQLTGSIGSRTFVPLDQARVGGNNQRGVNKKNRISTVKKQLDSVVKTNLIPGSRQKKYVQGVAMAANKGGYMIHKSKRGKRILYRVTKGGTGFSLRGKSYKVEPLYSVDSGRSVKIKNAKPFTMRAAHRSGKKVNKIFRTHAKKRLLK